MRVGAVLMAVLLLAAACREAETEVQPTPSPSASPASASPAATEDSGSLPHVGTIAYVSADGGLGVRNPSGERVQVYVPEDGQVYYPEWSPDGKQIAFTEVAFLEESPITDFSIADLMSVVVVDLDGNELLRVPRAMMPHWSPDGLMLAVGAEPDIQGESALQAPSTFDIATGRTRELAPRMAMLDSPRWSPDGSHLVYGTFDGLYVVDADKEPRPRALLTGENYTKFYLTPSWTARGTVIVFERDRSAGAPPGGVDSYVEVNGDGRIIGRVGDSYPSKCGRALFYRDHEAHSIPGTTFAAWGIECHRDEEPAGIWVKDMSGGDERFLDASSVVNGVGVLDVSPDGKVIAFSNAGNGLGYTRGALPATHGILNVYVMGIEGGTPQLLVEDAMFPIWQPQP